MKYKRFLVAWITAALTLSSCHTGTSSELEGDVNRLWQGFSQPQDSCRTKMWWFHGETETTREGITADLEGYKRAGIGGVVYYDQVHGKAPDALPAFSEEWWKMFIFAAQEAKRVGLTFDTHYSNGFCGGGPWITDETGMQMLVSNDTVIRGGTRFSGMVTPGEPRKKYHGRVGVLAFPVPQSGWEERKLHANRIIKKEEGPVTIVTDLGKPMTARSLTYQVNGRSRVMTRGSNAPGPAADEFYAINYTPLPPVGELEVSQNGVQWEKVVSLKPYYSAHSPWGWKTVSFPATEGRYFRLNLHDWAAKGDKELKLGDFVLSSVAKVDDWEVKAGLISEYVNSDDTPIYKEEEVIDQKRIIDISDHMDADGHLTWQAPAGNDWVVMRFDHVPTGGKVKHGRKNLMGLECDKMSKQAAALQWERYFKVMFDTLANHGLKPDGMLIDSHEAGPQNWTPGFEREFNQRRGYDLKSLLPVITGHVVGSSEQSSAVLTEHRRTCADLISDYYFGTIDSLCQTVGVPFTAQAVGNGLCLVSDPIQAKGRVGIPQGEFWAHHPDGIYDIKEASSATHIYGKRLASGEAFTDAKFEHSLAYIKRLADYAWCYGLNEFVVCASAYQPWLDRFPGSTAGGRQYCLNRNHTQWEYSRPSWDYQARATFLLRQGHPVVDFCVYLGENAPVKIRTHRLPPLPEGTDFDAFTSDALFTRLSAEEGRIILPDGMNYRVLILPDKVELTYAALCQIAELARKGAYIYGKQKPVSAQTYDNLTHREQWEQLVNELWKSEEVKYGRGRIYSQMPIEEVARRIGILPDIERLNGSVGRYKGWFYHRRTARTDIYFVSNHSQEKIDDTYLFRSPYRKAAWWSPVDGSRRPLKAEETQDGRVSLRLSLAEWESGFVILSDGLPDGSADHNSGEVNTLPIKGGWDVTFAPRWGGPGTIRMDTLYDWTVSNNPGVKYYSGTATYTKTLHGVEVPAGRRVFLSLESLRDVARVYVNSKEAGVLWCAPLELDITNYLQSGENKLRIEVANTWVNRMIFDARQPQSKRVTYAYPEVVTPKDKLIPSGITGEVKLSVK